MKHKFSVKLLSVKILTVTFLTGVVSVVNAAPIELTPRNTSGPSSINANGDIAWTASGEIYFYNGNSELISQITNTSQFNEYKPLLNDNGNIIWTAYIIPAVPSPTTSEIFYYNSVTGTTIQLTNNSINEGRPVISRNGNAAWTTNTEVHYYTVSTQTIHSITTPFGVGELDINAKGNLIWTTRSASSTKRDLYAYDLASNSVTHITDTGVSKSPKINDMGDIVWTNNIDGDDEVFYRDGANGIVTQLTNNSFADTYPKINNSGNIVWQAGPTVGEQEIYFYDFTSGVTSQITQNTRGISAPQFNAANEIVWHAIDPVTQGQYDFRIFHYSASTKDTTQLTTPADFTSSYPLISDRGDITWRKGNAPYHVMLYKKMIICP